MLEKIISNENLNEAYIRVRRNKGSHGIDKLVGLIYKEIKDIPVIGLIRKYLNSGVMKNGLVSSTTEGVHQGGNLSPLLSNIMLHELDMELERRGFRFCRYADDCNVYVKSR